MIRYAGLLAILLLTGPLAAQETRSIGGTVRDKSTGEPVPGVNIADPATGRGTTTGQGGTWRLDIPRGNKILVLTHIGYRPDTLRIGVSRRESSREKAASGSYDIQLEPVTVRIDAARILGQGESWNTRELAPGQIRLSTAEISRIPALFGEHDILNSLHSLPGVQSVGEGSGYFYVRGGNADQNLILLDGAPIYNPSHLLGVFSVINPSAIQSVNLFKSGIPARYGDRLASVIDLTGRDGDFEHWHGELSIGVIASKIFLEGPLVRNKVSVLLALRRTQLDLITPLLIPKSSVIRGSGYSFLDFNGRITWNTGKRSRIWLSSYSGDDNFRLKDIQYSLTDRMKWGNRLVALNSRVALPGGQEMNTTLSWSGYILDFNQLYRDYFIGLNTGLGNFKLHHELVMRPYGQLLVRAGVELQQYRFNPYQALILTGSGPVTPGDSLPYRAREASVFAGGEWNPGPRFNLRAGLRLMYFQQRGPFNRYVNDSEGFPEDTVHYPAGETLAGYLRAEPRLSLAWEILPGQTVKASASRQYQPVHMVPIASTTLPLDLWIPSTDRVAPQEGTSFSLGWYPDLEIAGLEAYAEGFYRIFDRQVEFREDQSLLDFVKDNIDRELVFGKGKAYGVELFIRKKTGKTQGWIGYTWSHAWRIFPGINDGVAFPPRHDRTHDFNLVVTRSFGKRWEGSLQFVYATGQPVTVPLSVYILNGAVVQNFSDRNAVRLPAYHRLDISMNRKPLNNKKFSSYWTFSVYNLYNRLNPFFIYYDLDWDYQKNLLTTRTRQIALLPLLPSVTWTGRF